MPKMTEEERKARQRAAKERYRNSEKGKARERAYGKSYREAHKDDPGRKERAREVTRLWRLENPEHNQRLQDEYRSNPVNREKARQRTREWFAENSDRVEKWRREYYSATRDRQIEKSLQWQRDNPEKVAVRASNYRARKRANGGKLSPDIVDRLMGLQKGKCACCKVRLTGENRHLDHVISLKAGGPNEDSNCQLLCASCNCSKRSKDPTDFMQSRGFLL